MQIQLTQDARQNVRQDTWLTRPAYGTARHAIHTIAVFAFALFVTGFPIAVHFVSPVVAIVFQLFLASIMTIFFTAIAPIAILVSLLFQNLFVSLFSDFLTTAEDYNFVRGYNFLTMIIV